MKQTASQIWQRILPSIVIISLTFWNTAAVSDELPFFIDDPFEDLETTVQLTLSEEGDAVVATVQYSNSDDFDVCLDIRAFPVNGMLWNDIFGVWADGKRVSYTGRYWSHRGPSHFRDEPVHPGETLEEVVFLNAYYDIPKSYRQLNVRLTNIAEVCRGDGRPPYSDLVLLTSNRVDLITN